MVHPQSISVRRGSCWERHPAIVALLPTCGDQGFHPSVYTVRIALQYHVYPPSSTNHGLACKRDEACHEKVHCLSCRSNCKIPKIRSFGASEQIAVCDKARKLTARSDLFDICNNRRQRDIYSQKTSSRITCYTPLVDKVHPWADYDGECMTFQLFAHQRLISSEKMMIPTQSFLCHHSGLLHQYNRLLQHLTLLHHLRAR